MRGEAMLWFARGLGLALAVVVVLAIAGAFVLAAKVVVLVIISILLASGLEPVVAWMRARTPLGRSATILAVFASFFALVLVLVFLIVPAAIEQSAQLGTKLPPLLANVRAWAAELRPTAVGDAVNAIVDLVERPLRRVELIALVAVVYVIIQIVEGNILVPIVMKNTIGVPPFLVIVSIIGGATVGGIVGALLAVPFTAAAVVILERLQARDSPVPLEAQSAPETPTGASAEQMGRTLPDAPGSARAR